MEINIKYKWINIIIEYILLYSNIKCNVYFFIIYIYIWIKYNVYIIQWWEIYMWYRNIIYIYIYIYIIIIYLYKKNIYINIDISFLFGIVFVLKLGIYYIISVFLDLFDYILILYSDNWYVYS